MSAEAEVNVKSDLDQPVHVVVQQPGVTVTLDAIYREVLETKALVAPLPNQVTDHESRLRLLEAFKNKAAGVAVVLAGASGVFGAFVSHLIK